MSFRPPRCGRCGSRALTLVEHHHGTGEWPSDEWHRTPDGAVVLTGAGYSASSPTGMWSLRCEDCDHMWTMRSRPEVGTA